FPVNMMVTMVLNCFAEAVTVAIIADAIVEVTATCIAAVTV
ncbi:hypothetical protein A2U01_0041707, partial [Trifolium medium]|nr:hypothetical protein [Trifolium medium]